MQTSDPESTGWADCPRVRQGIRYVLYILCALLVLADFVVHRHTVLELEKIPAFYALYGFMALVMVVLLAKGLRKLVGRDEDYYRQDRDDAL